ncbi:uncharacterized protein LOC114319543 [Camellia sinensis]|uniref:uncharacterized protein LOC114319543 n=1 Tax=Camellia sinensis TaxID=4442 RepID=UPI0010357047|nr:uncharacterized protein LOC114319543 [Camellia sinensis]
MEWNLRQFRCCNELFAVHNTQSGRMEVNSNVGENPLIHEGEDVEEPKKGKTRIVDLGLDEIQERVMREESGDGGNLPCSTRSPIHTGSTQGGTSRKVISPLVARRRGRPVTKRKVAKVDQIVNRFKATAKKQTKAKAAKLLRFEPEAQAQAQAQTPYYPYMVGTENSMYVPVAHGIGGTSLTPSDFISGTQGSLMSAPTQIYGSASGNLDITDLFD